MPGIRKRSPIQLLTRPDAVLKLGLHESRYIQHGMVVGDDVKKITLFETPTPAPDQAGAISRYIEHQ